MPNWAGYHVKTDGRAYFRPYIPKDLKEHLGPMPMVNLRMKASREAERLALSHFIAHETLIAEKRREIAEEALKPRPVPLSEYTPEAMQRFAVQLAQGFNRAQHAAIRTQSPRSEIDQLHTILAQAAGDVLSANGADGLSSIAELFLHAGDVSYTRGDKAFKAFVFEFATALDTEYVRPSKRRRWNREAVPPPPLPEGPRMAPKRLTLGKVVERYIEKAQRKPTHYTRKVIRCVTLFREMLGANTPVDSIRQIQVTDFLGDICRLPLDWSARFDKGTATVAQMLAAGTDKGMSPTTWAGSYQAPLKAFLRDAWRDYGEEGFPARTVEGIKYEGTREEGEETQRALTVPELRTFFEGEHFAALARQPEGESLYWLSLVALFTGARPREICQLNPQCDFGEEGGIHYLDFNRAKDKAGAGVVKTIKTGEERRIPLHPELVKLGFPAHLKHLKDTGADRLFPAIRVKKGNPYEVLGALFTELLKTMELYDNTAPPGRQVLGAYVIRKTFITHAGNHGIPTFGMTGHKPEHMTAMQWKHYHTSLPGLTLIAADLVRVTYPLKVPPRG